MAYQPLYCSLVLFYSTLTVHNPNTLLDLKAPQNGPANGTRIRAGP